MQLRVGPGTVGLKISTMKKYSLLSISLLLTIFVSAQDYKKGYEELLTQRDSSKIIPYLQQWEKATPNDPDVYIAYFNHYFKKSKKTIGVLSKGEPKAGTFVLTDSAGNTAGYMGDTTIYEPTLVAQAIASIDKGIAKNPQRLDMRFGKIYVLGQTGDYKTFTSELINTLHYSNKIGESNWKWANNKSIEDPKKMILGAAQDYCVTLYETNNDALLDNMRSISETVLQYYPDHVPSLSNIAITYTLQGNHNKALETLLKAEKIAPTDYIILNNIANIYRTQNDKPNAIRYYELVLKHGNDDAKEVATRELKKLRN
jgi:tetratricopeptide (TPR) repeat protein